MQLAGQKIVVVGGSSGIGLATADLAKRDGAEVIIASRSAEKLKAAADKLGVTAMQTDVSSDDSVMSLFRQCGAVDHVVVTAAQLKTGPFKTVAMYDVRSTMDGKFWGAWRCARAAEIKPGGSLTLVSGFLSVRPRPNSAIVGAANGALESLTRALALELAPVRVNCVSPGIIDTPIRAAMPEAARRDMLDRAGGLPAGQARRPGRRYRQANCRIHVEWLCHRLDRLSRWRRACHLTGKFLQSSIYIVLHRNARLTIPSRAHDAGSLDLHQSTLLYRGSP